MPFKQTIVKVIVRKDMTVSAYNENNQEIPFFSGSQYTVMKRIKARIERQKPCSIHWHAEEGAKFVGIDGTDADVFYALNGSILTQSNSGNETK